MTSTSISGVVKCPQEEAGVTQTCLWRGRIGSSSLVSLDWIYWDRELPAGNPIPPPHPHYPRPMLLSLGGKGAADEGGLLLSLLYIGSLLLFDMCDFT